MGPGIAGLGVQMPVVVCDVVRVEDAVLLLLRIAFWKTGADKVGVDGTIDHDMRNVDVARSKLTRHALCQRAQGVFGPGKGGEICRTAQALSLIHI